jgi:drug/metabolite transporter superfamily protein YnfA
MVELESEPDEKIWKKFLRTHWKMLVLFVVAAILAIAGAILVFLWFVGDAQVTSLVPATVGLWTIGYLVTFLLHLIFWEVLFIGIPVIITVAAIYFLWWKKIPDEERKEYRRRHLFGKSSRRTDGGGAISLLVNIVFIIKVYLDGNWNVPFATWTFDYLVYSYLWALLWILIIFGIPILLGGTWWIRHEMKKKP